MSIQIQDDLKYKILNHLQTTYVGKKLDYFMGLPNMWLYNTYFENSFILVLYFSTGNKEGRLSNSPKKVLKINLYPVKDLETFKWMFALLQRNYF